jgi:hypothetical protein
VIQVFPVYEREGAPAPAIAGYRAVYTLTLTVTNLSQIGRAIDAAMDAGANTLGGLTFGVRDPAKARTDALAAAVREAREKADAMAAAAGLRIRGIDRIVESAVEVHTREVRAAPGVAAAVPIEPGTVAVTAQVTIVFNY